MELLKDKTVRELREIAKELEITGRWNMTKSQLIEAIEMAQSVQELSDEDIEFEGDCIIKEDNSNQPEGTQKVTKVTDDYLRNIQPGTLVAFKRNSKELAMSGKFVSLDKHNNNVVCIMSKKGTMFKIQKSNILWVKTGNRWPRWVYNLFNNKETKSEVVENEQK